MLMKPYTREQELLAVIGYQKYQYVLHRCMESIQESSELHVIKTVWCSKICHTHSCLRKQLHSAILSVVTVHVSNCHYDSLQMCVFVFLLR